MDRTICNDILNKEPFSNLNEVDIKAFVGHEDEINCCAFSSDLKLMVTGSDDALVKLWDVANNKVLYTLKGHSGPIKGCCFSPDDLRIVSCAFDHKIIIWDTQKGLPITTLEGHSSSVESVTFSPCGQYLASGSWDKTGIVWNLQTCLPEVIIVGHQSVVQCCKFSLDGEVLATGSWDKTVQTWKIKKESNLENGVLRGHTSNIKALAFSCLKILASASWDCTVRTWDIFKSTCLHVLDGHNGWVQSCAFSNDGRFLVSAADDKIAHCEEINTCLFTDTGSVLTSGPQFSTVFLY